MPEFTVESLDSVNSTALGSVPCANRVKVDIDESLIDSDALKVVRRLVQFGYEAYLVGGGVRDLLLHRKPKDFDVATNARPEQVRGVFRNSRIIGRRFRLVHVVFGANRIVEVATFRRASEAEEHRSTRLIRSDNEYGLAHEDAIRRDLTINALLYDVHHHEVLDFVNGTLDIENRVIRTIGDPRIRFLEDPVRMLRSIKFCARLDLGMVPDLYDAIVLTRHTLVQVAKPRLFEELLKIMRCGHCHRTVWLLWETGLLHVFLPEIAAVLDDDPERSKSIDKFWHTLLLIDETTARQQSPLNDITLITLLVLEPMLEAIEGQESAQDAAEEFITPIARRLSMPRRISESATRIAAMISDMKPGMKPGTARTSTRSQLYRIAKQVHAIANEAAHRAST